jgi:hypothetical protein
MGLTPPFQLTSDESQNNGIAEFKGTIMKLIPLLTHFSEHFLKARTLEKRKQSDILLSRYDVEDVLERCLQRYAAILSHTDLSLTTDELKHVLSRVPINGGIADSTQIVSVLADTLAGVKGIDPEVIGTIRSLDYTQTIVLLDRLEVLFLKKVKRS